MLILRLLSPSYLNDLDKQAHIDFNSRVEKCIFVRERLIRVHILRCQLEDRLWKASGDSRRPRLNEGVRVRVEQYSIVSSVLLSRALVRMRETKTHPLNAPWTARLSVLGPPVEPHCQSLLTSTFSKLNVVRFALASTSCTRIVGAQNTTRVTARSGSYVCPSPLKLGGFQNHHITG
jgi:hypothetical protein